MEEGDKRRRNMRRGWETKPGSEGVALKGGKTIENLFGIMIDK